MRYWKFLALPTVIVALLSTTGSARSQVSINIGPEPGCPYGYYDFAPYPCAPYGYYGPEWFNGGVFIGAGPWFHGHGDFHGHVDNRFDINHGYRGALPNRGDRPESSKRVDHIDHFQGNEMRDGHGHVGGGRR